MLLNYSNRLVDAPVGCWLKIMLIRRRRTPKKQSLSSVITWEIVIWNAFSSRTDASYAKNNATIRSGIIELVREYIVVSEKWWIVICDDRPIWPSSCFGDDRSEQWAVSGLVVSIKNHRSESYVIEINVRMLHGILARSYSIWFSFLQYVH